MRKILLVLIIFSATQSLAQWQWSNPSVIGNNLNDVYFKDSLNGWAVGEGGAFIYTVDGGNTWQPIIDMRNHSHTAITECNGKLWRAAAYYNLSGGGRYARRIEYSTDNGKTWTTTFLKYFVKQDQYVNGIKSISFSSDSIGFACADSGLIVTSTNGGNDWSMVDNIPTTYQLTKIQFPSETIGYVCGGLFHGAVLDPPYDSTYTFGCILKTTDRGRSWYTVFSDSMIVNNLYFISPEIGWAIATKSFTQLGRNEYILKTTDGGAEWQKIDVTGYPYQPSLNSIIFVSEDKGYVCGSGGVIMATTDGGFNWFSQGGGYSAPDEFRSIRFTTSLRGFCVGTEGVVVATTDGGENWQQKTGQSFSRSTFYRVIFASHETGWVISYNYIWSKGRPWKTTNAGKTWARDLLNANSYDFINPNCGWAVNDSGYVYKTLDVGETWQRYTINNNPILNDISFANENIGWVIADLDKVFRSSDGGLSWSEQPITWTNTPGIGRIIIQDTLHVWLSGGGQGARTTNSGNTWMVYPDPNWIDPPQFSKGTGNFLFGNIGWYTYGDPIFKTTDGGKTFFSDFSIGENIWDLFFLDSSHGWAVGGYNGSILRYGYNDTTVDVKSEEMRDIPNEFTLYPNYPNPFNPITSISFEIYNEANITLKVYDILGREVISLLNDKLKAGEYTIEWNAEGYPSGVYFYRLIIAAQGNGSFNSIQRHNHIETRKLMLLR